MLNTFDKKQQQLERRLERERQIAAMEAAVSGDFIPPDLSGDIFDLLNIPNMSTDEDSQDSKENSDRGLYSDNVDNKICLYDNVNLHPLVDASNHVWDDNCSGSSHNNARSYNQRNNGVVEGDDEFDTYPLLSYVGIFSGMIRRGMVKFSPRMLENASIICATPRKRVRCLAVVLVAAM
eukprot:10847078-Ditylum_brightwellii.AAC.1